MNKLSNVEMMLLQMLSAEGELSGYEINTLVEERGYREWAGIGTTSIYAGLSKLEKKDLVEAKIDTMKQGKGPLPKRFRIRQNGLKTLKEEVIGALATSRQRDSRFDLALSVLPAAGKNEALQALKRRHRLLKGDLQRVKAKFKSQGGSALPFHVRELFRHSFVHMRVEMKYVAELIEKLNGESAGDRQNRAR